MRIKGKVKSLGRFSTVCAASKAYSESKSNYIIEIAHEQTDPRIKKGLLAHAGLYAAGRVA